MTARVDRFLSGSGFSFPGVVPRALTVAGSDSGGGAGIQADLKTFTALGAFGTSAITAITAQNTLGVTQVKALEPGLVSAQIDAVLGDIGTDAAKTGMLANAKIIQAVARSLSAYQVSRLVVDPVMVAASGHRLLELDAVEALKEHLLPLALVVTPNVPEAAALTGEPIDSLDGMKKAAEALSGMGCRYVVVKGGHLPWFGGGFSAAIEIDPPSFPVYPWGNGGPPASLESPDRYALDVVYDGQRFTLLKSPFFKTRNTHGTGCTFSAAIAACLALGLDPLEAIVEAKRFVTQAICYSLSVGGGHGPTNHLLRFSPQTPSRGRPPESPPRGLSQESPALGLSQESRPAGEGG